MKRRVAKKRDVLAELVRRLNGDGRAAYDRKKSALTVLVWEGTELDPPVLMRVDRVTLRRHLHGMRKDAADIWPDSDRMTGALNLLMIHIEEEIVTRRPDQTELVLDPVSGRLEWAGERAHQGIGPSSRK